MTNTATTMTFPPHSAASTMSLGDRSDRPPRWRRYARGSTPSESLRFGSLQCPVALLQRDPRTSASRMVPYRPGE
jgi:hypothetical protein